MIHSSCLFYQQSLSREIHCHWFWLSFFSNWIWLQFKTSFHGCNARHKEHRFLYIYIYIARGYISTKVRNWARQPCVMFSAVLTMFIRYLVILNTASFSVVSHAIFLITGFVKLYIVKSAYVCARPYTVLSHTRATEKQQDVGRSLLYSESLGVYTGWASKIQLLWLFLITILIFPFKIVLQHILCLLKFAFKKIY